MIRLSFHGADRTVTGSCHLVQCGPVRLLVDCGLLQGAHHFEEHNRDAFGFDPAQVDFVLLTHAHLDHCGRLPLLVRRGFRGQIVATAATRELTRIVLLDAAHLQEEEVRRQAQRRHRQDTPVPEPLYTMLDALDSLDRFGPGAAYGQPVDLAPGVRATFFDAGHILGSASVRLELAHEGQSVSVAFSGDLGNAGRPLLRDPQVPPRSDVAVLETTYGDRLHRPIAPSIAEFTDAVQDAFGRGGNVVIPTFALERAQEILWYLREGLEQGRIAAHAQVFLDSPMAISATRLFARHPECLAPDVVRRLRAGDDPLELPGLHFTRDATESMAINRQRSGAVILAGAGMCNGGRVRHHLRQNLWRQECAVIFVGFATRGTLARRIIDGARSVRIFDEEVQVRAAIHTINGFSAHADRDELLAWHRAVRPGRTFLVHGEPEAMQSFAPLLQGEVHQPALGESCVL